MPGPSVIRAGLRLGSTASQQSTRALTKSAAPIRPLSQLATFARSSTSAGSKRISLRLEGLEEAKKSFSSSASRGHGDIVRPAPGTGYVISIRWFTLALGGVRWLQWAVACRKVSGWMLRLIQRRLIRTILTLDGLQRLMVVVMIKNGCFCSASSDRRY